MSARKPLADIKKAIGNQADWRSILGNESSSKLRGKRSPGGAVSRRNLRLSDSVFSRLQLLAILEGTDPSSIAEDILNSVLPMLKIEEEQPAKEDEQ